MHRLKYCLLFSLFFFSVNIKASKIENAFTALRIYNYFEAKQLFEKVFKSETAAAGYGLSTIYYRNDNPFFNIDSAYKFIIISENSFNRMNLKSQMEIAKFNVNSKSIDSLKTLIHTKAYELYKGKNDIKTLNVFIEKYVTAPQCFDAIDLRNKMAFELSKKEDTYQGYKTFIETYPFAKEVPEAHERYESSLFQASTKNNTVKESSKRDFEIFIVKNFDS